MAKTFPEASSVTTAQSQRFTSLFARTGLSLPEISDLTGYSLRTVYRWKKGETQPNKLVFGLLHEILESQQRASEAAHRFIFIDLFAGIGGMRIAFESVGGKCIYTSEWDAFCRKTYQANFACDHDVAGDLTDVEQRGEIPEHDVLVAGFPCQPFSIAGVSKKNALGKPHGFRDKTQGTLFFNVAEILESHRPSAFLLENVKNLRTHDKGKTFQVICDTLTELGYVFTDRTIDSKGFLPQHRERIFIVGFLRDSGFNFQDLEIPDASEGPRLRTILHPQDGSETEEDPYTVGPTAKVSSKYTLSSHLWSYLKDYAKKHKAKGNGFGYGLFGPDDVARTLSARYYKDGSEILIKQLKARPRRLTPRECARLMGFDNFGESEFVIPVSDTQAYKQFGNSVAVPVVRAIAKEMLPHILTIRREVRSRASPILS